MPSSSPATPTPGTVWRQGSPFPAAGAAIVCGWRPGADGLQGFRFGSPPDGASGDGGGRGVGDGLRATVGRAGRRNRLTIEEDPAFARSAGTWAGEVADKLLADQGLTPADIDVVAANPLVPEFQEALATRLGVSSDRLSCRSDAVAVHTAGLAVALEAARRGGDTVGRTLLLVSAGAGLMAGAALLRG